MTPTQQIVGQAVLIGIAGIAMGWSVGRLRRYLFGEPRKSSRPEPPSEPPSKAA